MKKVSLCDHDLFPVSCSTGQFEDKNFVVKVISQMNTKFYLNMLVFKYKLLLVFLKIHTIHLNQDRKIKFGIKVEHIQVLLTNEYQILILYLKKFRSTGSI